MNDSQKDPYTNMTFVLSDEQFNHVKNILEDVKKSDDFKYIETYGNVNKSGNALYLIATKWGEQNK